MSARSVVRADVDVLVVGGGPTGLLAACELLRRGVRVRIVDRAEEPMTVPKALSLWPRAMDILEDLGVGEELRRSSNRIDAFSYFSDGRPLATFGFAEDLASRTLPQPVTESLLTARLHELGGKVERGVRLLCLDGVDFSGRIGTTDGVTALLEHPDGTLERTHVPWVIGADGAGSSVRGQLGIGFQGSTYEMAFALIDTRIEGELPTNRVLYYQAPSGTLVIVPMPDGVFRFLSVMPAGGGEVTVPMMQRILDERGPRGVRITEPVWQTVFRVHARHATDFRRGRVFLMGDAAHVHSPAGGQGMNNGLQDAHNLAWKLAAVVHGTSPAELLLSYGPERAEATRRIVRDTDLQTRAWMAGSRPKVVARDAAFRLLDRTGLVSRLYAPVMAGRRLAYRPERDSQVPSGRRGCGRRALRPGSVFPRPLAVEHGMSGPGADPNAWTLAVTGPDVLAAAEQFADGHPRLKVVRLRKERAAPLTGCRRAGYHLIRPDGHVAAHGHAGDLDRLRTELAVAFTPVAAD
ncbi:FAD-dependent monooxygenase [Streptomyces sp. NPDC005813]|uniref:FAD-dependent monooxygenase n=1 Tax=Streptomyces sp. NPDC005813 TaxID=3155592 RepID=UPI003401F45A